MVTERQNPGRGIREHRVFGIQSYGDTKSGHFLASPLILVP